jgi:hypothetical protein
MESWKNPLLSLGERCVLFCENEMKNKVCEDYKGAYTSKRIREYFSICTRLTNGKEIHIPLQSGNWCAASQSFALHESLLPDEVLPHGYRLGVVEIVSDCQRLGLWRPTPSVKAGKYSIKKGDIIVFDRSNPNKPETAWFRHIGRVLEITSNNSFKCISGNSGGKWSVSNHTLDQANLLGFGEYPSASTLAVPESIIHDWSNIDLSSISPSEDTGSNLEHSNFFSMYSTLFNKSS